MIWVGLAVGIISLICWIIILIDAFQDQIWKGIVGLICGLYLFYYAVTEFEHDHKVLIIIGCFGGVLIANFLIDFSDLINRTP